MNITEVKIIVASSQEGGGWGWGGDMEGVRDAGDAAFLDLGGGTRGPL